MANHVLEYVIRARDAASAVLNSVSEKFRGLAATVTSAMSQTKEAVNNVRVDEKFIHTEAVLDAVSKAMDRMGVTGERFNDVYDTLERRLNNFNRTGKGFEDLLDHFRRSMEDVKMSAKGIDHGVEILRANLVKTGTSGAEAAKEVRGGMRAAHFAVSALNGNVYALGRAFTYVLGRIKALGLSAAALTGISVAVYALTELVTKCVRWWREQKQRMEEIKNLRFEKHLKDVGDAQKEVNKELRDHERRLDGEIERKKKLIEQNKKLQEQELELARIQALSGKTGAARDDVNRDFDAQKAEIRARAEIARAQVEMEGETDRAAFLAKLEAKLQGPKSKIEAQLAEMDKEVTRLEEAKRAELAKATKVDSRSFISGAVIEHRVALTDEEKASEYESWQAGNEEYRKLKERRDRLKEQYDDIISDLEDFAHRREKAVEKAKDAGIEAENTATDFDIEMLRDEEEAWHRYYEELERLEEEAARQRERDALAQARLDERLHRQRIHDAEEEVRAMGRVQSAAAQRVQAAQARMDEAWGFYKDRGRLEAHISEMDLDAEARRRYEKDRQSLMTGHDADKYKDARRLLMDEGMEAVERQFAEWRSRKSLSVDSEAAMRVALAEDEQREANRNLARATEAAERAADALEAIQGEMENGGDE